MLMSCKCLNFIATTSSGNGHHQFGNSGSSAHLLQRSASISNSSAAVAPADAPATTTPNGGAAEVHVVPSRLSLQSADDQCSKLNGSDGDNSLSSALMHAFLQKYPRNFIFYSQCMEFFKQSIGPIPDLTINAINQRDIIYSLTLEVSSTPWVSSPSPIATNPPLNAIANTAAPQAWQISICINCNQVLCAKRLPLSPSSPQTPQFLINTNLWTTNEELVHRRGDKAFSETFGLLLMDHPVQNGCAGATTPTTANAPTPFAQFSVGSLGGTAITAMLDARQQRHKQLHLYLQQRLQREIAETDERIQRYTEQQFALLKSFREKSEQEYDLLVHLLQMVPEQQVGEWLDRTPPTLEVSVGSTYASSRRRNTIGSRRDLNSNSAVPMTPTTPTTAHAAVAPSFPNVQMPHVVAAATRTPKSSAIANGGQLSNLQSNPNSNSNSNSNNTTTVLANMNRKMSNFDTPPATPEATPMSVGNSPTFRPQQSSFQQQYPTPTAEMADDCLFDLEGIEDDADGTIFAYNHPPPTHNAKPTLQHHQQHQHFMQRGFINNNAMSDLDESDDAEEAEDALDLDNSMAIPMHQTVGRGSRPTPAQLMPYAQSLPIEIANSPMTADRTYNNADVEEDELDNNVDIAASIKALAKSVHGEAVFGDLPRPRLRSQI